MKPVFNLEEWWPWYDRINKLFNYDMNEDQRATDILSGLISKRAIHPESMEKFITHKPVLVFGAGPSLEENLYQLQKEGLLEKFSIISADGATTALLKVVELTPQFIVSDLDGKIEDLLNANRLGSTMVIHGHGDNITQLKKYVPKFVNIIGTTQVKPTINVYNFGGFTDGDRAVFFAASMKPSMLVLAGMDLGQKIGKYSKEKIGSQEEKILKLKVCKELLEWLASKVEMPLYNVTGRSENIRRFKNVSSSELVKIINSNLY
ncbi:MAG: 6-hydroxymethylpterin diphosphokinase MptE-like protein [Candidatus Bathyarchaeia archaeon]|jgi:uncharacterized Rossmann fold enzyme